MRRTSFSILAFLAFGCAERSGDTPLPDLPPGGKADAEFGFVMPYFAKPEPEARKAEASTDLRQADVVFAMDTTGSMGSQINQLRTNIGSIINNASIAAHRTHQGGYLYSAAKAAVAHLTRLAGEQLGPSGIRVNAISPGAIATPIFWGGSQKASQLSDEDNARKLAKLEANLAQATPLPRSGEPEDIAYAAVFLASDEGSFVNAHDLVVDGGRIAMFHEKPRS